MIRPSSSPLRGRRRFAPAMSRASALGCNPLRGTFNLCTLANKKPPPLRGGGYFIGGGGGI